ncbi:MAG TPA: glycosyltransferase [Thermomicrobiales bacterium]|nr:glycosyltransferase [Thermomicrobiales bacterium]
MSDVTVVVVHWNVPELLRSCLRSIAGERARSSLAVETIVVDAASPVSAFREVVASFSHVSLIELSENRGFAAGCNAGIERGSGAALLLLNADVELAPGALDALWQGLWVSAHVGMVAPLLLNADGSLQSAGYRFPGVANVIFDLFSLPARLAESPLNGRVPVGDGEQPVKIDYPLGAAMMARRDAIEDVGPLDESYVMYSEEIDWARRFAERDWTTLLVPRARVTHHRGGSTSQRPAAMREALWLSRARYHERWATPRQRRLIAAAVRLGTRLDDRRASSERRTVNARIRDRFAVDRHGL